MLNMDSLSFMFCRSILGFFQEQLQSPGAWWDIRAVREEDQSSWNFYSVSNNQSNHVAAEQELMRSGAAENVHRVDGKLNVETEDEKVRRPRKHVPRLSARWVCGRLRRRRLKWGERMWCIYRASAQRLFDLPASSQPLPTTI